MIWGKVLTPSGLLCDYTRNQEPELELTLHVCTVMTSLVTGINMFISIDGNIDNR